MTTAPSIEIFRPGRFTAVDGTVVNFSAADLRAAVAAYDYDAEPAPLVKGHPQLDHPAYGWVGALRMEGDVVVAEPTDIEPAFAEEVRSKRYRRVSASWYPPANPQNPRPGSWYLKHVGFLGASAPSVRGLAPVQFSEAQDAAAITIDLDPTETIMTEPVQNPVDFAAREAAIQKLEAELADRQTVIEAREAEQAEAAREATHNGNVAFAEGLIAAGRLAPAGKDKIVGLLDVLTVSAVANFGEANGDHPPVAVFKELLGAATPIVSFAEAAPADDRQVAVVSFAAPAGFSVDQASLDIHAKALAHQATHAGVGYLDAVRAVS